MAAWMAPPTPGGTGGGGEVGTDVPAPPPGSPRVVWDTVWAAAAWDFCAAATLALKALVAACWAAASACACCWATRLWMLAFTLLSVPWYWEARVAAWNSDACRLSRVVVAADCCCWSAAWVACNWFWAVCRLSIVVVTLPVAMEEYSDRMPVVLGSDENIWVTWLLVPLLV